MDSYSCCTDASGETKKLGRLQTLLGVISESSRLKILCILRNGEHCVCELMEHVHLSQSLVSHHMGDLKGAGIVTSEKRGLKVFYSLTPNGKRITDAVFNLVSKGDRV
jgi:ArsR family transcriptional regulator, arsenate/arsenite/antimonite-responsive transcriptional repressor